MVANTDPRLIIARDVLLCLNATMAHVHEVGPNGPMVIGLQGNWPLGKLVLEQTKDADIIGVFTNKQTGHAIDFHWGFTSDDPKEKGQGLAKLLRWHPDTVTYLDKIIFEAVVVSQPNPDRYILSDGVHLIIVSLRHNNEHKRWLLTAFKAGPKPSKKDRTLLNLAKKIIAQAISRTVNGANVAGQTNVSIAGTKSTDRLGDGTIADLPTKIKE